MLPAQVMTTHTPGPLARRLLAVPARLYDCHAGWLLGQRFLLLTHKTSVLRWNDIRERTILVERSVAFGQLEPTKTDQSRTVRLLAPLAETLAAWRQASPRSTPTELVFPAPDGHPGIASALSTGANELPLRPPTQPACPTRAHTTCATALSAS